MKHVWDDVADALDTGLRHTRDGVGGRLRHQRAKIDSDRSRIDATDNEQASGLSVGQVNKLSEDQFREYARTLSDQELWALLRKTTPNQALRDMVQGEPGKDGLQPDPLYPDVQALRRERLEADHVVPLTEIMQLDRFRDLNWQQMREVVNSPENFMGLSDRINASKGDRGEDWDGHPEFGPLSAEARQLLSTARATALVALNGRIASLLDA